MSKPNDTINALKRLERAGDQESTANAKLIEAARVLFAKIDAESRKISRLKTEYKGWAIPYDIAVAHNLAIGNPHNMGAVPSFGWHPSITGTEDAGPMCLYYTERLDRKLAMALGDGVAAGLMSSLADWAELRIQMASSRTAQMDAIA